MFWRVVDKRKILTTVRWSKFWGTLSNTTFLKTTQKFDHDTLKGSHFSPERLASACRSGRTSSIRRRQTILDTKARDLQAVLNPAGLQRRRPCHMLRTLRQQVCPNFVMHVEFHPSATAIQIVIVERSFIQHTIATTTFKKNDFPPIRKTVWRSNRNSRQ